MRIAVTIGAAAMAVAVALAVSALQARAEDRSQLIACQAMIDRATQPAKDAGTATTPDDPALARCRQIAREWMLRDARMSVDERGQPLR
jgi:hypothetical protein